MKKYIVVEKSSVFESIVGSFDNMADAGTFALLCKKTHEHRDYSVFENKTESA